MTRRPDETTEAYHVRLADRRGRVAQRIDATRQFIMSVGGALRADAARHDITDTQFMNGDDPLTPRPAFPVGTPADELRERVARAACEAGHHAWPSTDNYNDRAEKRAWLTIADAVLALLPVETPAEGPRSLFTPKTVSYDPSAKSNPPPPKGVLSDRDGSLREALPRLDDGIILAACEAHYGKRRVNENGGIHGISMTVDGADYDFQQAFRRMWAGARKELMRRAALAAVPPETAEMEGR